MKKDLFNKSMYFNIRGTILEIPMLALPLRAGQRIEDPNDNHLSREILMQSEWCVDYKGGLFKNKRPTTEEVLGFLKSDRKVDIIVYNIDDAVKYTQIITRSVSNYVKATKANLVILSVA